MITLTDISKKIGTRTLFDGVSCTFSEGNRYGLTGPNGAGKSTLLKIMMRVEEATSGTVSLPQKVGFLKQNIEAYKDYRLIDVVIMGNDRLWKAFEERDKLYEVEMTDKVGIRLGELEEVIGEEDGYMAEANAEILLEGVGIPAEHFEEPMHAVPSDQQFKALLCQALFGEPEALLLDEPTNHLDLSSIAWLENFLQSYQGTVIVVSHDKHFLNAVTTHIADIDYDTIITYTGNYDDMLLAKTSMRDQQEKDVKSREKKIANLKEFVAKFGAGTRASSVKSKMKEIDRLQPQELKASNIQRPYIRFQKPHPQSGQSVKKAHLIHKYYDDKKVIQGLELEVQRGDKIGVIGNNGRGKTTLLKLLAGVIEPDKGKVHDGHQVSLGYFPQHHEDIVDKTSSITLYDWVKQFHPGLYEQDVRGALGKLLFAGGDVFKPVKNLSGGETARAILASLMLFTHNTLILDEPNNHLDLESVSALGVGLGDFDGTVICAAHDRELINHFANRIIAFEDDGIHIFSGTLDEYLQTKAKQNA